MAIDFKDLTKLKWYYQILIVAGVCGGLLALFWYQFLQPIETDIHTRISTLDDLQRTIAKSLQQQKQLVELKKQALQLQAKLDMLNEAGLFFQAVSFESSAPAVRLAIVGLDHDHVWGLLRDVAREPAADLVAIAGCPRYLHPEPTDQDDSRHTLLLCIQQDLF